MKKIFIIGDMDTVSAFRLSGVEGVIAARDDAPSRLEEVIKKGAAGIVMMTSEVAVDLQERITQVNLAMEGPVVIEIPGTYASVTDSGNVTLTAGQELSVSRTSGGSALLLAIWSMQRTVYAPQDSITTSTSTEIRDRWAMEGSLYRAPHTWVAWTNTDAAATLTITGSPDANPNLNKWGTFAAGLLFDCN